MFRRVTNNSENAGLVYNYSEFICETVLDLQDLPTNIATVKNGDTCAIGSKALILDNKDIYILNNQNQWIYLRNAAGSAVSLIKKISIDGDSNLVFEMTDGQIFKVHLADDDILITKSNYDYLVFSGTLDTTKKYHITDENNVVNYYDTVISTTISDSNQPNDHTASVKAIVDYIRKKNMIGEKIHVTTDNAGFYKIGEEVKSTESALDILKKMLHRPIEFDPTDSIVYFKNLKNTKGVEENLYEGLSKKQIGMYVTKQNLIDLNTSTAKVSVESPSLVKLSRIPDYTINQITIEENGRIIGSVNNPTLDDDGMGVGRVTNTITIPVSDFSWTGKTVNDTIYSFYLNANVIYTDDLGTQHNAIIQTYHTVLGIPDVGYKCTSTDTFLDPSVVGSYYYVRDAIAEKKFVKFTCQPVNEYIQFYTRRYNGLQYDLFDENDIKINNAFKENASSFYINGRWYVGYISKNKYTVDRDNHERLTFVLKEKEIYD